MKPKIQISQGSRRKKAAQLFFCCVSLFLSLPNAWAFEPAQTFEKKCSSCHTIGGGVLKGPDLKGVTERREEAWLVKFITSSYAVIQSGDPQAVKLFNEFQQKEMPDSRLSEVEIKAVLEFIRSGGQGSAASVTARSASEAKPEDVAAGREYYLGTRRLTNGGPACVSCHSVGPHGPLGGGTLAKDLTHIYSQYSDNGLSVALQKAAFPVMEGIFATQPLTKEENFAVKAFLYDADRNAQVSTGQQKKFVFLGIGGTVLVMGIIDFSWRRRRKQSVRRSRGGIR